MDCRGPLQSGRGSRPSPAWASPSLIDPIHQNSPFGRSRIPTATTGLSSPRLTSSDLYTDTPRPEDTLHQHGGPSDTPLDAFDKELLTGGTESHEWPEQRPVSFHMPKRSIATTKNSRASRQATRDDLHATSHTKSPSRSSAGEDLSSPSVVTLATGRRQKNRNAPCSPPRNYELPPLLKKNAPFPAVVPRPGGRGLGSATSIQLNQAVPVVQGISLVSVADLPDRLRPLFPFPLFNAVQSKCFATAFKTDQNLVLSAPTGSGKTVVMELAICHLKLTAHNEQFKIVYQCPTKALCRERYIDWQAKFSSLDLPCAELTGDTDVSQMRNVQAAQIIVTTPEKWDSITRRWKDHAKLMHLVKLFLIDEVHILNESRGATLEAVVSRMKSTGSGVRFVALSATIPNSEDVAQWLGKDSSDPSQPAHREKFGEEFRPVQLQKAVYGFPINANDFVFDSILDSKLPELIAKHSRGKPILIFCPFRRSCVKTAKSLAQLWTSTVPSDRLWAGPKRAPGMLDHDLRQLVSAGVAFHHAGLDPSDRQMVERGFMSHDINIICCTSTLAVGLNLPCYLAIVKGTMAWTENGCQEYADLEIMQMLGRAGRPQYEQSACAVILTRQQRVEYYNSLVCGQEPLESCLHLNLIDHLNAEIGLGTVSEVASAKRWLASTFLSVRLSRNPDHYRLKEDVTSRQDDEVLAQICAKDVTLLREADLVTQEGRLSCTEFGDAMARYYVKFDTMKTLLSLPPKAKLSEILSVFAQSADFRDIRLRSGEKALYKHVNKDVGIKFPIKVDLALPAHKVSLLVQAELGGVEFPVGEQFAKHKNQFQQDKAMVFQHASRLIRCVIDCQLSRGDSVSARHALELARNFAAHVWENSPLQLKQLDQIGNVAVRKLANAGIKSIELLENTEAHRLESVIGRGPPFGMKLLSQLSQFPKLRVRVKFVGKELRPPDRVKVTFKSEIGFLNENVPVFFRKKPVYVCFLAETSDGKIIDFRRISATKLKSFHEVHLSVELMKPSQTISCHVMCDEVAATSKSVELKHHFPASLFSSPAGRKGTDKDMISQNEDESGHHLQDTARKRKHSEIFDENGLDDGDLLAAENVTIVDIDAFENELTSLLSKKAPLNSTTTVSRNHQCQDTEPLQLRNGKWPCNHKCKDKGNCKHLCCKEGLDKPPKPSKKPIHGGAGNHASISSSLDAINRNPPAEVFLSPTQANDWQKGPSSCHGLQTLQQPRCVTKEAKNLTKLHQATTLLTPSPTLRSATSQGGTMKTETCTAAPASSTTAWSEIHLDEDAPKPDWVDGIDLDDAEGVVNLKSGHTEQSGKIRAVQTEDVSQVDEDLDFDDEGNLEDIVGAVLGKNMASLNRSMPLENDAVPAKEKKDNLDSKQSFSSQTVRESSSFGVDSPQGRDPFQMDDHTCDFSQQHLDSGAGEHIQLESPGKKVEGEHADTELLVHGSSISPTKKLFFTSPERGQTGPSDGMMTVEIESQPRTDVDSRPSGPGHYSSSPAIPDTTTGSLHQSGSTQCNQQGCGMECKISRDANAEHERRFTARKNQEERQQVLMDDIDPSFYDQFKDIVEFI